MSVPRGRRDWVRWHADYREPGSPLHRRLDEVRARIRAAVGPAPAAGFRLVAMCAGQGDDLLGALAGHPAAARLAGRLVELDPVNAGILRERIAVSGLPWEVVEADAADPDAYAGAIPADLVLACGVFGNIPDADVLRTIAALPAFCRPQATVIWTRHRQPPDLTPRVRAALAQAGFRERAHVAPDDVEWSVGVHRYERDTPGPLPAGPLFRFGG